MARLTRLALHGLVLVMPLLTLAWGLSAPHPGPTSLLWVALFVLAIALDFHASPERRPPVVAPGWPFDAALFLLAGLQFLNLALLLRAATLNGLASLDTWVGVLVVGSSSGYSAIVVAHELVHRPQARYRQLGRLLLCTVLYEHFSTEHVRGHHKRVATADDPATARFGERLWPFLRRTLPGQLRSAWDLEQRRLDHPPPFHVRQLQNRVLQGIVVEWSAAFLIGAWLGPAAFVALLLQAAWAVLLLETVNYIEHWGLQRQQRRVSPTDSWDSEGWFTYYTLVGLARHADHHAHASRPWQDLRTFDESPKMPWGYWATVITAIFRNDIVRARLTEELQRKRLGPWAPVPDGAGRVRAG